MADHSAIEWTDATWNPVRGCSRVSTGCRNCYAERMAARWSGEGQPYKGLAWMSPTGARWTGRVQLVPELLEVPLRWRRPRRIFVNSMSDLFHEALPFETVARVFDTMRLAPWHTFQVLTKRPSRMRDFVQHLRTTSTLPGLVDGDPTAALASSHPNVWLGVSVEDKRVAAERVPLLLDTSAARRFLSCEPLLGPLDLTPWLSVPNGLHWVIAGGESGKGARAMDPAWVRSLRDQCQAVGVPFFFKQWGDWAEATERDRRLRPIITDSGARVVRVGKARSGRLLDGRTWDESPAPTAHAAEVAA